jgi:hypothetical protein
MAKLLSPDGMLVETSPYSVGKALFLNFPVAHHYLSTLTNLGVEGAVTIFLQYSSPSLSNFYKEN